MTRPSIRQAINSFVFQFPDGDLKTCYQTMLRLGYKITTDEVKGVFEDAQSLMTRPVSKFREVAPDHNAVELDLARKGEVNIGIVSDTHFGSRAHQADALEYVVDQLVNKYKVTAILCPGDLLEGFNVYRGQVADLSSVTEDDQITEALAGLPRLPGKMKYYWISGNHDLSWHKNNTGHDPLVTMDNERKDFTYLGKYSAYVKIAKTNTIIQMIHPQSKGSYSLGAAGQTFVDKMPLERRPDIVLFGHWHGFGSWEYKNVWLEMCGSFQGPGDLSVRHGWSNRVGGKLIQFSINQFGKIQDYMSKTISPPEKAIKDLNFEKI